MSAGLLMIELRDRKIGDFSFKITGSLQNKSLRFKNECENTLKAGDSSGNRFGGYHDGNLKRKITPFAPVRERKLYILHNTEQLKTPTYSSQKSAKL